MMRMKQVRVLASVLLGLCLAVSGAEEKKDRARDSKKHTGDPADVAAKAVEKADAEAKEKEAGDAKGKKPEVPADAMEAFRNSKDPAAMEIVALHNEVDKAYTELATARNVALGGDKEAKKAERDAKALESKIKRGLKKLEGEVEKYVRPLGRDYDENKGKYDALKAKGDQLSDQGQEKKATAQYQQADRYTGKIEGLKRQIDTAKAFLYFESAEGVSLDDGDDDDGDKDAKDDKGGKDDRGSRTRDRGERERK